MIYNNLGTSGGATNFFLPGSSNGLFLVSDYLTDSISCLIFLFVLLIRMPVSGPWNWHAYQLYSYHLLLRFGLSSGYLFWKYLLTWLTICSLCILTICNFSYFPVLF